MAKPKTKSPLAVKTPSPFKIKEDGQLKPHEEVITDIVNTIRRYSPEQQNKILAQMLKEVAATRHQEMMLQRDKLCKAEANIKEFLDLQYVGERALKEIDSK